MFFDLENRENQEDRTNGANRAERLFLERAFGLLTLLWRSGCTPAEGRALPQGADLPGPVWEFVRFLDEIPGGFLIYRANEEEEIVYANAGLLRIFQCGTIREFQEWTHNSFQGMVLTADLGAVQKSISRQIASSRYDLDYVEYRIRRRDGEIRWLEDYGHFVRSEAMGDLYYVFLADATEKRVRMQLEQQKNIKSLIESYDKERALINREYLRRLEVIEGLSVSYESIFYVDPDEDTILPYRLSGRTRPSFEAHTEVRTYSGFLREYIERWVHPEDRERVARVVGAGRLRESLRESGTCYVNYRAMAGSKVQYLQLRLAAVRPDEEGSRLVMGCRRMDDEIQQQVRQKQELAEALSNATLAMAAKNTFLSNMSHEMRTPLNAILGFTALARRDLGDTAALTRYLDLIEASGQQLLDQINRVLELSQAGGETIAVIACDLAVMAGEICRFLEPQAAEKGISFSLDCTGLVHSAVYADREKLYQLILYLANNAVTYTSAGGVKITLTEGEQLPNRYTAYRLVVEDTGAGIGKEALDRVFGPLSRAEGASLNGAYGIGLGLTIVKNIVDMLGGSIRAQSEPDRGSRFTVTLRLRRADPAEPAESENPGTAGTAHPARQCRRILLVEDNELNREIETELLTEAGFEIETAEDGKIGLEMVRAAAPGRYDLVLMDLQMPVMDGWTSARSIRALEDPARAGVPIIALSANTMPEDLRRSSQAGMDAHLPKPVDIPLLLETIREVMEKRALPL